MATAKKTTTARKPRARKPAAEAQAPTGDAVAKAIEQAGGTEGGKLLKVLYLDDSGQTVGEYKSEQLPESEFTGQERGIQNPPFMLEQLVYLAETHPVHSAALEQKAADIAGKGWEWVANDPDLSPEEDRDALAQWFEELAPDDVDMHEIIHSAWLDVETVGWGLIEVARDTQGVARRLYHVPAHTVRAHRDGFRLLQIRDARKVWFKRWGAPPIDGKEIEVDARTGNMRGVQPERLANELFVLKRPSRRSTWYGIPGYVSAIGWITLALAARDDNLFFFANRREPRWAIILSNLADDPDMQEDLRRSFVVDLRQPHRNIMIPITGPGEVKFQKLSDNAQDGTFGKLDERATKSILIAHRVPVGRLANAELGPLGGDSHLAASAVYKEAVVTPGQELLDRRLNRFIAAEYELASGHKPTWAIEMDDLDIGSDREDLDQALIAFHGNMITLREARHRIKLEPLMRKADPTVDDVDPTVTESPEDGEQVEVAPEVESEYNDMLFTELPGTSGAAGGPGAHAPGTGPLTQSRLDGIDRGLRALLVEQRETADMLAERAGADDLSAD